MKPFTLSTLFGVFCLVVNAPALAREGETLEEVLAVQLYSQDALIKMINENTHLDKVVADRCQLVQDIEARP